MDAYDTCVSQPVVRVPFVVREQIEAGTWNNCKASFQRDFFCSFQLYYVYQEFFFFFITFLRDTNLSTNYKILHLSWFTLYYYKICLESCNFIVYVAITQNMSKKLFTLNWQQYYVI